MKYLLIVCTLLSSALHAQSPDTAQNFKRRPFQLTFVSPLGTNGVESHKVINNVSLNLLAGYAAGVEGAEFGGFANVALHHVRGAQLAGFANVAAKRVKGAQLAGFANYGGRKLKGAQLAGFANVTAGKVHGAQLAGFCNIGTDSMKGAQLAGFASVARYVDGAQISGFANVAQRVKGLQLGFMNFADTVDGAAIGFLSFVLKGYHKVEVFGNEALYANVAFKTGTSRFYNILTAGARLQGDTFIGAYGYGIGTEAKLGGTLFLNIDGSATSLNRQGEWGRHFNLMNRLDVTLAKTFGKKFAVFLGPSWVVYLSNRHDIDRNIHPISVPHIDVYSRQSGRTRIEMWPGLKAGVRVF